MSSVQAKLFEGPLDGQVVVLEGDPLTPPREHLPLYATEAGELQRLIYRRGANFEGSGPDHLYYYEGAEPVHPATAARQAADNVNTALAKLFTRLGPPTNQK